jgi:hypothetical protein
VCLRLIGGKVYLTLRFVIQGVSDLYAACRVVGLCSRIESQSDEYSANIYSLLVFFFFERERKIGK